MAVPTQARQRGLGVRTPLPAHPHPRSPLLPPARFAAREPQLIVVRKELTPFHQRLRAGD